MVENQLDRRCITCGSVIVRNPMQSTFNFRRRTVCNLKCLVAFREARFESIAKDRQCLACGKLIERRPGDYFFDFNRRKYCNKRCVADSQKRQSAEHIKLRLMKKVKEVGACWIWQGLCYPDGYGKLKINGRYQGTHRVAYSLFIGPIPDGLCVCHHCDTPGCVNPAHLFVGTNTDNMRDMKLKGRAACGTTGRRLSRSEVIEIVDRLSKGILPSKIATAFGVTVWTIRRIKRRNLLSICVDERKDTP